MDKDDSIENWKKANVLFELYIDKPALESLKLIEKDESIQKQVRPLLIRLVKSIPSTVSACLVDQADLSFFNTLEINLSGQIFDDYRLISQIAKGGMSQVYKAERINTDVQKLIALKVLVSQKDKLNEAMVQLFKKEQLTLSKLSHTNIVSFHHSGISSDGIPYLVMEYLEGTETINTYCSNNKLSTFAIIDLILPITDAINYAHQQLIIHRDIKPQNTIVDKQGVPYLLDFGISSIAETKDTSSNITASNIFTPGYASPEQILDKHITTSSDIFSFTAMFLGLITGKKPLIDFDLNNYDYRENKKHIDRLLEQTKLDTDLRNIINKGLAEKPEERYQTILELQSDLRNWKISKPISATVHTNTYLFKKFTKRHPVSFIVVTSLVVAVIFSLSMMFRQMNNAELEAKKAKQVTDFLIESIQSSDPDVTKGQDLSVKEFLNSAKVKIQESSIKDPLLATTLEQTIGIALAKVGQYKEAEKLLKHAIAIDNNNIDARLNLAQLYLDQNIQEESRIQSGYIKKHLDRISKRQKLHFNQILASQMALQGNFAEAVAIITNTMSSNSIEPKQIIKSHLILANILDKKGDSHQAVEVLEKALTLSNENFGILSTSSTNISKLLADALTNISSIGYEKQITLYKQTIDSQIKLYGEKHPLIAKSYLQYGFALKAMGDLEAAKNQIQLARKIALENFSSQHILIAHIDLLLSQIQFLEKNPLQAIETLEGVVKIYQKTYGINNFETNQVQTTLALYLIKVEKGQEAIRLLLPLYESQKQQLGEIHQATLYVALNLNKAYNLIGDFQAAIVLGQDALEKSKNHFGNEFSITIGLQAILGESYLKNKLPSKALSELEPLLKIEQVTNNANYHKRISELLIQAYLDSQQQDLARQMIRNIKTKYYLNPNDFDEVYQEIEKIKAK